MSDLVAEVYCRFSIPGVHSWGTKPQNGCHDYLSKTHRHQFDFEVTVQVDHDDRAVEFLALRDECMSYLHSWYESVSGTFDMLNFGGHSCEMIARNLFGYLEKADHKVVSISVEEDNENGAMISRRLNHG